MAAFAAFLTGCGAARDAGMAELCRRARSKGVASPDQARLFFETNFKVEALPEAGVLTAYFAPEYPARRQADAEFSAPVRPRPADLVAVDAGTFDPAQAGKAGAGRMVAGRLEPYPDRAAIEAQPVDQALAWMRPEELFFLQIQGSGVLIFEDGRRMKAAVAATNGRAFLGIANPMRERGLLAANDTSGDSIRAWLAARRGPQAEAVMRLNPRYVFFTLGPDDGRPPAGAAGIPLPAGRAVAIDPTQHSMGELIWLDAATPTLAGAFPAYRRLVTALDVGGSIKGRVRADLYLGEGDRAGAEAGRVRHVLKMYRLVPLSSGPQSP
jgi:membrane-bound lytic murein transglycosylase A